MPQHRKDYKGPNKRGGPSIGVINIRAAQPAATAAALELVALVKHEPLERHLFREKEQGRGTTTKWTCGCGRRHLIPNVDREGFTCPACSDVFNG